MRNERSSSFHQGMLFELTGLGGGTQEAWAQEVILFVSLAICSSMAAVELIEVAHGRKFSAFERLV